MLLMRATIKPAGAVLLALLCAVVLRAQESGVKPCSAPEFRQFDFWVGQWDLTWGDSGAGTNSITVDYDSCVIIERFDSAPSDVFRGMSVSTYDTKAKVWRQTWVDNTGNYFDFEGVLEESRMVLSREAAGDSGTFLQRMVWYNISPDTLDWNWERSDDGGETWRTLWHIDYTRRKQPR